MTDHPFDNPELVESLGLQNYQAILEMTETLDFAAVSMKLETFGAFPRAEHDGKTLLQSEARGDPAAEIPLRLDMIGALRAWLDGRDAMLITTGAYSFERDLGAGFETAGHTIDLIPTFVAFLRQSDMDEFRAWAEARIADLASEVAIAIREPLKSDEARLSKAEEAIKRARDLALGR